MGSQPKPPPTRAGASLLAAPLFAAVFVLSIAVVAIVVTFGAVFGSGSDEAILIVSAWGGPYCGALWGRMALDAVFKETWNGWPPFILLIVLLGVIVWACLTYAPEFQGLHWTAVGGGVLIGLVCGFAFLVRRAVVEESRPAEAERPWKQSGRRRKKPSPSQRSE
jgi:hypothetical protein